MSSSRESECDKRKIDTLLLVLGLFREFFDDADEKSRYCCSSCDGAAKLERIRKKCPYAVHPADLRSVAQRNESSRECEPGLREETERSGVT